MGVSLYSVLPDTLDTQHAKELRDMQSEVNKLENWFVVYVTYPLENHLLMNKKIEYLESQLTWCICCPVKMYNFNAFRLNTEKLGRNRHQHLCISNYLKLWKLGMLKRLPNCRVRYSPDWEFTHQRGVVQVQSTYKYRILVTIIHTLSLLVHPDLL